MDRGAWWAIVHRLKRVRHDWATLLSLSTIKAIPLNSLIPSLKLLMMSLASSPVILTPLLLITYPPSDLHTNTQVYLQTCSDQTGCLTCTGLPPCFHPGYVVGARTAMGVQEGLGYGKGDSGMQLVAQFSSTQLSTDTQLCSNWRRGTSENNSQHSPSTYTSDTVLISILQVPSLNTKNLHSRRCCYYLHVTWGNWHLQRSSNLCRVPQLTERGLATQSPMGLVGVFYSTTTLHHLLSGLDLRGIIS